MSNVNVTNLRGVLGLKKAETCSGNQNSMSAPKLKDIRSAPESVSVMSLSHVLSAARYGADPFPLRLSVLYVLLLFLMKR